MIKILAAVIGLALAGPALTAPIDVGPAVGAQAPAVSARDAKGDPARLADIAGPKGVVLVFVRSAAWCPYCQAQLIDLKAAQAPLTARGYGLAALSYDAPEVLAAFAQRREIGYDLLSDEESKVIRAFGLLDPQYPPGHRAHGVPQPAIFVLSPDGRVRAKLAEEGYKSRPPTSAVLEEIDALPR